MESKYFKINYDNGSVKREYEVFEREDEPYHYFIAHGNYTVGDGRLLKKYCTRLLIDSSLKERIEELELALSNILQWGKVKDGTFTYVTSEEHYRELEKKIK